MNLGSDGRRVRVIGSRPGRGRAMVRMPVAEAAKMRIAARLAGNPGTAAAEIAAIAGKAAPATPVCDRTQERAGDFPTADAAARWVGQTVALVTAVSGAIRALTPFRTKHTDRMAAKEGRPRAAILVGLSKDTPLGRVGRPEEITAMVVGLFRPMSSYFTSQSVNIDGGFARGLLQGERT